jgi:hypothetical protein
VHLSGELNLMKGRRSESDKPASNEGRGMKVPVVTRMRPEAVRSTPGQAEARVNCVEGRRSSTYKCFSDLGVGVKSQSRTVIAGSYQS